VNRLIAVCACILLFQAASGQTPGRTLRQSIEGILSSGIWEGQAVKQLRRAGDAAAVAITKIISDKNLSNHEIETVLDMLDASFSDPTWVEVVPDREPRTALLVLRYLDCSTQDVALKRKVAETRKHILEEIAKPTNPGP
jgi:hypothetical protein